MKVRGTRSFGIVACAMFAAGVTCWLCAGGNGSEIRAAARDAQANVDGGQAAKVPVLVELFTAEGCSSCPPADALLGVLDRQQPIPNARIIVLSEHVDYWNGGGWRDQFSSSELTERQKDYQYVFKLNDVYTPQMVVNGAMQLNGSDGRSVQAAIEHAADSHPIPLQILSVQIRGKEVTFTLRNGMPATPENVDVYAALVDPEDTTQVNAGENHGRRCGMLEWYGCWIASVAHGLHRILGRSRSCSRRMCQDGLGWTGCAWWVFAQTKHSGPVVGVAACLITDAAAKTSGGSMSLARVWALNGRTK